jgi:hypothetical protein
MRKSCPGELTELGIVSLVSNGATNSVDVLRTHFSMRLHQRILSELRYVEIGTCMIAHGGHDHSS